MANGWDGADPAAQFDAGEDYELGDEYRAEVDVTITHVRIWHSGVGTVVGREARIWSLGGAVLKTITIDDTLPAGWTEYAVPGGLDLLAGNSVRVSYEVYERYGFTAGGFPNPSADGAVTAMSGRFSTAAGTFPVTESAAFFGVDIVYSLGAGGNTAPTLSDLELADDGLDVTATVTAVDAQDDPGDMSYLWEWGDGSTTTTGEPTANHTYADGGLYAVLVTVTDTGGLKDSIAAPLVLVDPLVGPYPQADVRAELAAALTAMGNGIRGHVYRPAAIRPGDAWPTLGPAERADGDAWMSTWQITVCVPTGDRAASEWFDQHIALILDGLKAALYVTGYQPVALPTNGGGDLFAVQILGQRE